MISKKRRPSKSSAANLPVHAKRVGERAIQEISAGGVVFKRTPRGVFFAVMLDSYGKWAFPKGHVENGEALEETAARETLEELGLDQIRLLEYLGKIDIWFRDRFEKQGALIHKDIHYYLFEAPEHSVLRPDPSQHAYEARWINSKRVLQTSSYSDMVPILQRGLSYVFHKRGPRRPPMDRPISGGLPS